MTTPEASAPDLRAAIRKVLQHHGLTKHGDGVVEADLIAALASSPPAPAEPVALTDEQLCRAGQIYFNVITDSRGSKAAADAMRAFLAASPPSRKGSEPQSIDDFVNGPFVAGAYPREGSDKPDAVEANARRYQWLREHFRWAEDSMQELWFDASIGWSPDDEPNELDRAIDAAMRIEGSAEK